MNRRSLALIRHGAAFLLMLAGCAGRQAGDWADVRDLTPTLLVAPAASDAAVAADHRGRVALTWVTRDSLGQDLWLALSADSGLTFAPPLRVNPIPGSVSSDAESRPIAAYGEAGELLIAWSERRPDSVPATDLVVRASADGGLTLGPPVIVNDDAFDGRPGAHGLASLVALPEGGWLAVWMDPRENARAGDNVAVGSLFYSSSSDGGQSWSANRVLTGRACACCRVTAVANVEGRVAVAYRAVSDGVRDPALALSFDGGASFPLDTVLSADGWRPDECPADGPVLTMDPPGGGHFAWFTGTDAGGAWIAPWRADGSLSGLKRPLSDSLLSARHPRLVRMGAATLIVVEGRTRDQPTRGVVAVRSLDAGGTLTPWLFLGADASHAWLAVSGERSALVCWTEHEPAGDRLRLARVTVARR